MKLPIYQIDAFTNNIFQGNPAAVVVLDEWIENKLMQKIAAENNLSETAFIVKDEENYAIRWFTPVCEVDLCGHATLASAHLVLYHLETTRPKVTFSSKSGDLTVEIKDDLLSMNFPSVQSEKVDIPEELAEALKVKPAELYKSDDYMAVFNNEKTIQDIEPDFELLKKTGARGIIVTAPGESVDFVSRFFAPAVGINEDPVTGSAHTKLVPYWSKRLGKKKLRAEQISKRGGRIICEELGDRVELSGNARTYLMGEITTK